MNTLQLRRILLAALAVAALSAAGAHVPDGPCLDTPTICGGSR